MEHRGFLFRLSAQTKNGYLVHIVGRIFVVRELSDYNEEFFIYCNGGVESEGGGLYRVVVVTSSEAFSVEVARTSPGIPLSSANVRATLMSALGLIVAVDPK